MGMPELTIYHVKSHLQVLRFTFSFESFTFFCFKSLIPLHGVSRNIGLQSTCLTFQLMASISRELN